MEKKAELDSGEVLYKAIDPLRRSSSASDCIHALTDIRSGGRLYYNELVRQGDSASHFVGADHDWIFEALGLGCYPIWYREYNGWRFNCPQR
jgi:hypothetical protein